MTRVEYGTEVTINTGNFENVRPSFKIIEDVRDGEHPNDAIKRCEALVDSWLERKIDEIHEELKG